VRQAKGWFLFVVAVFVGSRFWLLSPPVDTMVTRVAAITLLLQMGLWGSTTFVKFLELRRERQLAEDPGTVATIDLLGFVIRVAVWAVVLLLALDNLGVDVTALVAGLGVGGIAVALAAQNILGDLFASLSIVLDKPFVVGDFLIVGEFLGSVEKVGIKTTRLRSLSGEQLVFSNNDLLSSRIRNYGRMFERRVLFSIGVTYQTPADKLKLAATILREAVEAQDKVRFDRAHFSNYGDFALSFEVVYYVLSPDYNVYMDIQQAINLTIYERFAEEQIEFAYPTQTLFVSRADAASGEDPVRSEG
jgi:small-conductance mechanosensitive channel